MADPRLPIESLPFQGIAELRRPGGHASQSGNVAEGRLGQRWPVGRGHSCRGSRAVRKEGRRERSKCARVVKLSQPSRLRSLVARRTADRECAIHAQPWRVGVGRMWRSRLASERPDRSGAVSTAGGVTVWGGGIPKAVAPC